MKAKTFDRKFDTGEEVVEQLDLGKARRVGTDPKRVNVGARTSHQRRRSGPVKTDDTQAAACDPSQDEPDRSGRRLISQKRKP